MQGPETRYSLLMRLQDLSDPAHHQAWTEFVEIYQPLVYQVATRKGLQHADAQDMTQEVFSTVGQAIVGFDFNPNKGSFRGWLYRVTRNLVVNFLTRGEIVKGSGDTDFNLMLNESLIEEEATQTFDIEYQRELFQWAAKHVEKKFAPETWQAFWLTCVDGSSIEQVAKRFGKSNGAIRIARCRVLSRLKEQVQRYAGQEENLGR